MPVEGRGLLGRAFAGAGGGRLEGLIFARGVADSSCDDPAEYARETGLMRGALDRAASSGLTFVYFSGAPIYGHFGTPVDEDTPIRPVTAYGIHQARAEDVIRAHAAAHLIIRLPNVVGPGGNAKQLIPSLAGQARAGLVLVQEDAERDVVGVDRVVQAVAALVSSGVRNRTVVVASGISTPVRDLSAWLATELGLRPVVELRPGGEAQRFRIDRLRSLAPAAARFEATYPRDLVADYARRAVLSPLQ